MRVALTDLHVRSANAMVANFYAADAIAGRQFRAAVQRNAEREVRLTKVFAAVDTGFMRDHTRYELTPSGLIAVIGWFGEDFAAAGLDFYPPYPEFGTATQQAQPALIPAHQISAPQFEREIAEIAAKATRRALRGGR